MTRLILASSSPYRQKQLEALGVPFDVCSPNINEDIYKNKISSPQKLAEILAQKKAETVAKQYPQCAIIAGDQLVALNDSILGKAGSAEQAIKQLQSMNGQTHQLITSISLYHNKLYSVVTNITELKMRSLTNEQITNYVYSDQAWDCAGSYKIEKNGLYLFEEIQTTDPSAIVGLPMLKIVAWLLEIGFSISAFTKTAQPALR